MSTITNTSKNRWERIWLLAKIEFKLRYYENKLGLVWALIKPLIQVLIYYVVFKVILPNRVPDFAIYLFAGIIVWQFFNESNGGIIQILKTKKYLYEYSNMSKIEIYLASLISASIGFFFNTAILIGMLLVLQIEIGLPILYFPILFAVTFSLFLGTGLILSNIYLIAKDINQVWPLVTLGLMWISPKFLTYEMLMDAIPHIELVNPLMGVMVNFRNILMYNQPPDLYLFTVNTAHAILALTIGFILLKKIGSKSSEIL